MNPTKTFALLAVVLLTVPTAAGAAPLDDHMPADAVFYVGWAGKTLAFSGSMLGQLLDDPALEDIQGALEDAIQQAMANDGDKAAVAQHGWSMAKVIWRHPLAVGVFQLGGGEGKPPVSAALLIDLEGDRDAFAKDLDAVMDVLGKEVKITQATAGSVKYRTWQMEGMDVSVVFLAAALFLALGADTPAKLAAVTAEKSLKADPRYLAAMKAVNGENVQIGLYADCDRLGAGLSKLLTNQSEAAPANKLAAALGVDKARTLAGTVRVVDRGMYTKVRVFSPAPHRGLLMALSGKPLTADDLTVVPADAILACAMNLSPSEAYREALRAAGEIDPNVQARLARTVEQFGKGLDLSIPDDVLASLGDTWVLASAPSLGGIGTGTFLSVEVKDEAKLAAALAKVVKVLDSHEEPAGEYRPAVRWSVKSLQADRAEISYVSIAGGYSRMPVAPAWMVFKGRLYVALWPQVLQAVVTNGRTPLGQSPAFASLRKMVGENPTGLVYFDTPSVLRTGYAFLLPVWTIAANELRGGESVPAWPHWLPPLTSLERYFRGGISTVSADEQGIVFESYGTLPGPALILAPAFTPIPYSLVASARRRAMRAKSMSNLRTIGWGCQAYASDYEGRWPDSLDVLATSGYLSNTAVLVSPLSGRVPPRVQEGKLVGECDYVYRKPRLKQAALPSPSKVVLAHERLEINAGRGANVLFADGHVKWVDAARLKEVLSESDRLQKQGEDF